MKDIKYFVFFLAFMFNEVNTFCQNESSTFSQAEDFALYIGHCRYDSIKHLYYKNDKVFNGVDTMNEKNDTVFWENGTRSITSIHDNTTLGIAYYKKGRLIKFLEKYYSDNKVGNKRTEFFYDSNGNISDGIYYTWDKDSALTEEIEYESGKPNGLNIAFHQGHLTGIEIFSEGRYVNFYGNGLVSDERIFIRNSAPLKSKNREWYENGNEKMEQEELYDADTTSYKDATGKINKRVNKYNSTGLDGKYITWYENGQIKESGYFDKGEYIGMWQYYYESGKLRKVEIYNNNHKLVETKNYDNGGNLEK